MRVVDPKTGRICFRKSRKRYDRDCSPRELTFSCYRRFPFLARDRVRNWFVESIQAARRTWPVDLWAWVILPEHVHLLVAPREPKIAVGRFAGAIKEQTARRAIQWLESNSPAWIERITVREGRRTRRRFWQPGGGYDRNVLEVETLHEMIDYLHFNPVRRGFVARSTDWEWSSARWYAGMQPVRLEMDRTIPMRHPR